MREKAKTVGALFAAEVIAYGARPLIMGMASWSYMIWFDYLALSAIVIGSLTVIRTRQRSVAIAALSVLVLFDALDPVQTLIAPN